MLIRAEELASHLTDPTWIIFDCRHDLLDHGRGEKLYRESHLPGAQFASIETALAGPKTGANGRHPLPAPAAFADFLAQNGVTPDSTIVAYDDSGGAYATRLWWLCRWIGLRGATLLDGGLSKWAAEGRPVTKEIASRQPAPGLPSKIDPGDVWSADDVEQRLADSSSGLIDARAGERYRGEVETIDPVAGHIPGALNRFHKMNLRPDLSFRSATELREEFQTLLGARAPDQIGHYCGSGITACVNLFAMEYAGLPGSKLYAGSWSEWVAGGRRPLARGAG